MHTNAQDGFPRGWTIAGYVLLAGSALLVGRIIYEETILTWVHGPQMVGFAMAHGALPLIVGAGLVGLLGGSIWLIASLVLLFRRQFHVPLTDWVPIVLLCALAAMLFIPYETWQELTVRIAGPGNYGNEFLIQQLRTAGAAWWLILCAKDATSTTKTQEVPPHCRPLR